MRGPECEPPDAGRYEDAKVLQQNSDFEEHDDYAPGNELDVLKLGKGQRATRYCCGALHIVVGRIALE
jgi:hypothetical protein